MRIETANKVLRENMVYFDSWDEFATAVEQLFVAEPNKVTKIYGLVGVLSFNSFIFMDRPHVHGNNLYRGFRKAGVLHLFSAICPSFALW